MSTETAGQPTAGKDALPVFTRKATGLVREVNMGQMIAFTAASTNPLGLGLVIFAFAIVAFPRANPYIAIGVSGALCLAVWVAYALLTSAIPRVGGDYTINTRIMPAWLALAGNIAAFINGIVAAALYGTLIAASGISPILTVIGSVAHSHTIYNWGQDFGSAHHTVLFVTAVVVLALITLVNCIGTRLTMRFVFWLFVVACVGLAADVVIMLFTSHSTFVSTVNKFAGHNAYAQTVAAGAKAHLYPHQGGYSVSGTIGAIYLAAAVTIWTFWGTYLSSEFKGAGVRRRQMITMVGTGAANTVGLILLLAVFTHTIGYDFFTSSIAGNFSGVGNGAIGTAGYVYFGALVASGKVIVALLAIAFLGWWLPAIYINIAMPQRALLAWSFDGLLPRWLSDVNPRTHTPVRAMIICYIITIPLAAWISYSSTALSIIAVTALFGFISIGLVGVSAVIVKWRRPDLYGGSPADWKIAGIPILPFAGVGTVFVCAFLIFSAFHWHTQLGVTRVTATIIAAVGLFVVGSVWYFAAAAVRRRQGLDLSQSYKVLPPE
jgi:amino acid transporter